MLKKLRELLSKDNVATVIGYTIAILFILMVIVALIAVIALSVKGIIWSFGG